MRLALKLFLTYIHSTKYLTSKKNHGRNNDLRPSMPRYSPFLDYTRALLERIH